MIETVDELVALVVEWASQKPPMPRAEFEGRLRALLDRRRRLNDADRRAIARAMASAPRNAAGRRRRGCVAAVCERYGVSRQTANTIARTVQP